MLMDISVSDRSDLRTNAQNDAILLARCKGVVHTTFNQSITIVHISHIGSDADDKDAVYQLPDREYMKCPKHNMVVAKLRQRLSKVNKIRYRH